MIVRRVDKWSVTSVEGYDTLAETSIGENQEEETDNESIKSRLYIKPIRKWQSTKRFRSIKRAHIIYVSNNFIKVESLYAGAPSSPTRRILCPTLTITSFGLFLDLRGNNLPSKRSARNKYFIVDILNSQQ